MRHLQTYESLMEIQKYAKIVHKMIFGKSIQEIPGDTIRLYGEIGDYISIDGYDTDKNELIKAESFYLEKYKHINSDIEFDEDEDEYHLDILFLFDDVFQMWWMDKYGEDGIKTLLYIMNNNIDENVIKKYPDIETYLDSTELGLL